jgi:carboxylesterase type B
MPAEEDRGNWTIDPPTESAGSLFTCEQLTEPRRDTLAQRIIIIMSASHHPTDIHLRQHRAKKRNKLRARIAAAPATGRAALEAKVQRTYSPFHSMMKEKLPPAAV